ncbi:fatty acid desaturase, partial [Calditrichota bacterium]
MTTANNINGSDRASSLWQIVTSFLPMLVVLRLMYLSLSISYSLTLALSVLGAGFFVRIFIIQHDCGHGSFFKSNKTNHTLGLVCSMFTLIPYYYWRKQHAIHHATTGDLDRRGHGDITVHTIEEYLQLSKFDRLKYRLYRNPFILLVLGPIYFVLLDNRMVLDRKLTTSGERANVHLTNLMILGAYIAISYFAGWLEVLLIATPILWLASSVGIWLFYVQHQFDDTYWRRTPSWKLKDAALQGSSYLKLPRLIQWFTGNIG